MPPPPNPPLLARPCTQSAFPDLAPADPSRVHLRIAGLGVRGDATLADFLRRSRSLSDPPSVAAVVVWPSPDKGWPDVPAADADDVPPEYRGVIPDELLVRPQDVVLEKWLGKGSFGDAYKAAVGGSVVVVKVRCCAHSTA